MGAVAQVQTIVSGLQSNAFSIRFPPFQTPTISEPGCWNLEGDRAFATLHPLSWNYLLPQSPNYWLKKTQKQVYLNRIEDVLSSLQPGAPVLELGGGIGRFSIEWLQRGFHITHTDPNEQALALALEHLANAKSAFSIWQLSAENLKPLNDNCFEFVSAFEVFCYLTNPLEGLLEAARVLQPNGTLVLSVETAWGALARGESNTPPINNTYANEHDSWVHFYTRQRLREQLEKVGLEVESIQGVHYLLDGPYADQVDFERLHVDSVREELVLRDKQMDDGLHDTPRALLAIARKPASRQQ